MGRPTSYKAEYAAQALKLCKLGLTDEQIAFFFEVDLDTIALWAWECEDFFNAITPSFEQREQWQAASYAAREKTRAAKRKRRANSVHHRIADSMRARMWAALKGKTSGSCLSRLGYTLDELKQHLEARFLPGMTWENYGQWHIDHKKPCALFDLSKPVDFAKCWALENLQPLWAEDNIKKGASYGSA